MYIPQSQSAPAGMTVLMRMKPAAPSPIEASAAIVHSLDEDVPIGGASQLTANIDRELARPKLYSSSFTAFAALAIILAAV